MLGIDQESSFFLKLFIKNVDCLHLAMAVIKIELYQHLLYFEFLSYKIKKKNETTALKIALLVAMDVNAS